MNYRFRQNDGKLVLQIYTDLPAPPTRYPSPPRQEGETVPGWRDATIEDLTVDCFDDEDFPIAPEPPQTRVLKEENPLTRRWRR